MAEAVLGDGDGVMMQTLLQHFVCEVTPKG